MMKICLLFALLSSARAVTLKSSVVLTSADVQGTTPLIVPDLLNNRVYRVYGTYALAGSDEYAKNVFITDNTGASFNIWGLSQPNADAGVYFLDSLRTLRAPITITDKNVGAHTTPYTIYIVDAGVIAYPMVSARHANGLVDSYNAFVAAGLTVLSAEPLFTMYGFDMYGLANMVISSVGFDDSSSQYNILSVSSREAGQSFITVYGPIATVSNVNWAGNARFKFSFSRQPYNALLSNNQLSYNAAFALVSPGYLSIDKQPYNIPYTTEVEGALSATYNWPGNNYISAGFKVQDIQGSENVHLEIGDAYYDFKTQQNSYQMLWANRVMMSVQNRNGAHIPRFLIQVTSGASLSFSLAAIIIVSFFSKLY